MAEIDVYEVVRKLVGPIEPVGDTNIDATRFENLRNMASLVERLIGDINWLLQHKNSNLHSMKNAGMYADKFLTSLGIEE